MARTSASGTRQSDLPATPRVTPLFKAQTASFNSSSYKLLCLFLCVLVRVLVRVCVHSVGEGQVQVRGAEVHSLVAMWLRRPSLLASGTGQLRALQNALDALLAAGKDTTGTRVTSHAARDPSHTLYVARRLCTRALATLSWSCCAWP